MTPSTTLRLRDPFGNVVVLYARERYHKATLDGPRGYVIGSVSHGALGAVGYLCASRLGADPSRLEIQGPPEMVSAAIGLAWTLLAVEIVGTE